MLLTLEERRDELCALLVCDEKFDDDICEEAQLLLKEWMLEREEEKCETLLMVELNLLLALLTLLLLATLLLAKLLELGPVDDELTKLALDAKDDEENWEEVNTLEAELTCMETLDEASLSPSPSESPSPSLSLSPSPSLSLSPSPSASLSPSPGGAPFSGHGPLLLGVPISPPGMALQYPYWA